MANVESLMDKLVEKMSDGREDQLQEVISMQKTLKTALLKKNFKEHPAMARLLMLLTKREQGYSLILANKEDLDDVKREGFFQRRKELRFILGFFNVEPAIAGIEAQLTYQLSDDINSGGDVTEA